MGGGRKVAAHNTFVHSATDSGDAGTSGGCVALLRGPFTTDAERCNMAIDKTETFVDDVLYFLDERERAEYMEQAEREYASRQRLQQQNVNERPEPNDEDVF